MDQEIDPTAGETDSAFEAFFRGVSTASPDASRKTLRLVWDQRPVRVELERPVTFAGKEYSELVLQPLKAGHLRKLPVSTGDLTMGDVFEVAGKQAGVVHQVIEELVGRDAREVITVTTAFFALFQGIGAQQ